MSKDKAQYWYLWPNQTGNIAKVLRPQDNVSAINEDYHANKIHVIEYSAYAALEEKLSTALEALDFYASCPLPTEGSGIIPERIINGGEHIPLGTEARCALAKIKGQK